MTSRADAEALDAADPLAFARPRFELPEGVVYLDGNSLGALPRGVEARVEAAVKDEWGARLVRSWNDPWIDLPRRAAAKIARLIGAGAEDVAVCDSVSVDLFKLLAAALALRPGRGTVLCPGGEFPTDVYVADGLARLLGEHSTLRTADGESDQALRTALDDDVAVVATSHVSYRSGAMRDLAALAAATHEAGALLLVDLSHSVGAVEVELAGCDVDLAVGCGYKYLNGGPGAPAFLYVAPRWQDRVRTPIQGWLGHADFFAFEDAYRPAPGVERFHCGTWPILSLTALDAALDVFDGVEMAAVRAKSLRLGDLFLELARPLEAEHGLRVATPRAHARRGSQVSLRHPEGYAIVQALIDRGVIGDFRPPDLMRFGLAPLYLRYADVWDAVAALGEVLAGRVYDEPKYRRRARVT